MITVVPAIVASFLAAPLYLLSLSPVQPIVTETSTPVVVTVATSTAPKDARHSSLTTSRPFSFPWSTTTTTATTTITTVLSSTTTGSSSSSSTSDYLPRILYPGTYKNYCGPTPEVQVQKGCTAHGWHGDTPVDLVDDACRLHDVTYCQCESQWLTRQHRTAEESVPLLSSMVALRFTMAPPAAAVAAASTTVPLTVQEFLPKLLPIDADYRDCIHRADQELIARGIQVRSEMQATGCSTDPSLAWFCDMTTTTVPTHAAARGTNPLKSSTFGSGSHTLQVFEKVNLDIFLRDLDSDEEYYNRRRTTTTTSSTAVTTARSSVSLVELERQRQWKMTQELQSGKTVAEAVSSPSVQQVELQMLQRLTVPQDTNAGGGGGENTMSVANANR
jgi:hypothetical protein